MWTHCFSSLPPIPPHPCAVSVHLSPPPLKPRCHFNEENSAKIKLLECLETRAKNPQWWWTHNRGDCFLPGFGSSLYWPACKKRQHEIREIPQVRGNNKAPMVISWWGWRLRCCSLHNLSLHSSGFSTCFLQEVQQSTWGLEEEKEEEGDRRSEVTALMGDESLLCIVHCASAWPPCCGASLWS